jgi:hypothetical protein
MDVPSWRVRSLIFLIIVKIAYFTLRKNNLASQRIFCTISVMKGAVGVTSDRNEVSQREEVEAWMPIGPSFKDESQLSNQLKCLASPWLSSPMRQRVKLKASFKPIALKKNYAKLK